MRIKRIELCGFKSFPDRTVLTFDSDVTSIVGPNGCGKSNIMDALRWAMGEQSAKALRGKQMDDVVFIGSDSRNPQAMAEVTLTFSTDDGLAPVKYATYREIEVTRRMFRESGESHYFVNKVPVRLRDVTDLFLGTGAGTRAYSLIEQGRIGYIVTARPQDRRVLIEEAAGITRYRAKRVATERQLAATDQNLVRLRDRLHDKEEQAASLKRQAQKAERFKAYRDEQRGIELRLAAHEALSRLALVALLQRESARLAEETETERAAAAAADAALETERAVLREREVAAQDLQGAVWELTNRIQLAEATVREARTDIARSQARERTLVEQRAANLSALERGADERAVHAAGRERAADDLAAGEGRLLALAQRLGERREEARAAEDRLSTERRMLVEVVGRAGRASAACAAAGAAQEDRVSRRLAIEDRLVEARRRAAELDEALGIASRARDGVASAHSSATRDLDGIRTDIAALRVALAESDRRLGECHAERERAASRIASLGEIVERHEAFGDGVRALLGRPPADDRGPLASVGDRVTCDDGYEAALAAVLGDTLQRLICERRGDATAALAHLRDGGLGRASITPRQGWRSGPVCVDAPLPDNAERLLDRLRVAPEARGILEPMLAGVFVVGSLAEADLLRASGSPATFVTRAGEVLLPDGTLCGGSAEDRFAPFLHARAERERLERELPTLQARLDTATEEHAGLRARLRDAQDRLREQGERAHQLEIEATRCAGDLSAMNNDRVRCAEEVAALEGERAAIDAAIRDGAAELERLAVERSSTTTRSTALEESVRALSGILDAVRAELEQVAAGHAAAREDAVAARVRRDAAGTLVDNLDRRLAELARENEQSDREADDNAAAWGEARGRVARLALDLEELTAEHRGRAAALATAQASFEAQRSAILEREAQVREHRDRLGTLLARATETRAEAEAAHREVEFIDERLRTQHETALCDAIAECHATPPPDENERRRAEELARLLQRMGGVNLLAIEEHREAAAAVETMTAQRDDLEKAVTDLRAAITRMNRESRLRFRATFDAVNERFQKLFPKMFRGGRAYLQLTESDDLLEAGVDIVAQPPGKKLQAIELLSGGEKALTAVSLVFALFLYKPSPFCVLDEVDAPLDDANVGRFCDLIHDLAGRTQFIVVTHVKQTMERADVLYGVTMEEPGVSKIVSVRLKEGAASTGDKAASAA